MDKIEAMVDIAVITYVHKKEQFLKNCIRGLLGQSVSFQWHVLCYKEPDVEMEGLTPTMHLLDDSISNKAQAYNFILPKLVAKYIAFNDADDISLAQRFEKQVAYLENHTSVDILGGGLIINERYKGWNMNERHQQIVNFMMINNPMVNSTIMVRNKPNFWGVELQYNTNLDRAEDYDFWLRCAQKGLIFSNLKEALISYHQAEKDNSMEKALARLIRERAYQFVTGNALEERFKIQLHQYAEKSKMGFCKRFLMKRKLKSLMLKNF